MIAVREFTSGAECIAHAQALRKKFYAKPANPHSLPPAAPVAEPVKQPKKVAFPVYVPKFLHLTPSWKRQPLHFDAHMVGWREKQVVELKARSMSPTKAYICRRAHELGFTFEQVISSSRKRDIVKARHLIMWEIRAHVKPGMSYPELGRLFGGRDHSTLVHAIRKIEAMKASEAEAVR